MMAREVSWILKIWLSATVAFVVALVLIDVFAYVSNGLGVLDLEPVLVFGPAEELQDRLLSWSDTILWMGITAAAFGMIVATLESLISSRR